MNRFPMALAALAVLTAACDDSSTTDDQRPIPSFDDWGMDEDTVTVIDVIANDRDDDGDPLALVSAAADRADVLVTEDGKLRVSPKANYNGRVEITYTVSDGILYSTGQATMFVRPINDAPVAQSFALAGIPAAGIDVTLRADDVDDTGLTYIIVTPPQYGTLTGQPPTLHYTPNRGYSGLDTFRFRASDGTSMSEATASLQMQAATAPVEPTPRDSTVEAVEDTVVEFGLTIDDPDGKLTQYDVDFVDLPRRGAIDQLGGRLRYSPVANTNGVDVLRYRLRRRADGVTTPTATVTLDVKAVADLPIANPQDVKTAKGTPVTFRLSGIDFDSAVSFRVVHSPAHGTITVDGAAVTYQPAPSFVGKDSLDFVAVGDGVDSDPATVSISVTEP